VERPYGGVTPLAWHGGFVGKRIGPGILSQRIFSACDRFSGDKNRAVEGLFDHFGECFSVLIFLFESFKIGGQPLLF
jgi:hypothetical protein